MSTRPLSPVLGGKLAGGTSGPSRAVGLRRQLRYDWHHCGTRWRSWERCFGRSPRSQPEDA